MYLLRLQYGNGTQIVRVEAETPKRLTIRRYSSGHWMPTTSTIKRDDPRIYTDMTQAQLRADLTSRIQATLNLYNRRAIPEYANRAAADLAALAEMFGE